MSALCFGTELIRLLFRPDARISGAWCNQRSGLSHPRRHPLAAAGLVDLGKNPSLALLCPLSQVIQCSSSTPTFYSLLYPCLHLLSKVSIGQSLFLFPSSWNSMASLPMSPNWVMHLKPPWLTFPLTSVRTPHLSKSKLPKATTSAH